MTNSTLRLTTSLRLAVDAIGNRIRPDDRGEGVISAAIAAYPLDTS